MAFSLGASKYIALLNDHKVPSLDGRPIAAILESEVAELAGNVTHRELLDQAAEACRAGIPRVHLLDGKMRGVLVEELFSEEGVGTMVHTDSYREIRPLKEEDIPELLSMIARSVVDSKLVNRNYEDIAARIDSYYVLTLDDSIVGCVAVYPYPEHHSAELGCLYIKHRHEGRGYGRALCEFPKRKAEEMGMEFIFALSQSAVHYFRDRMHYAGIFPRQPSSGTPAHSGTQRAQIRGFRVKAEIVFYLPICPIPAYRAGIPCTKWTGSYSRLSLKGI